MVVCDTCPLTVHLLMVMTPQVELAFAAVGGAGVTCGLGVSQTDEALCRKCAMDSNIQCSLTEVCHGNLIAEYKVRPGFGVSGLDLC